MMNIKVIGTGAAGNKAGAALLTEGVLNGDNVLLINSTLKDIPADFRQSAVTFSDSISGCGKERALAGDICMESIGSGRLDVIDSFITEDTDVVIIVSSTEGGTGSGTSHILGKYCRDVLGRNVIFFGFTGFEEDGRGLQNTIEYFQDLDDESKVQIISNKMFLDITTNKLKAEKLANEEFIKRVRILMNEGVVDSEQNIDETDYMKLIQTPGFMICDGAPLPRLKDVRQFTDIVTNLINNNKSLEVIDPSCKRLGVYLNVSEKSADYIDYSFETLKEKLGTPYEIFTHIQYNEEMPESVSFIASGIKMPLDEVKEIYEKYKIESEKVNKKKDNFFSEIAFESNEENSMFNSTFRRSKITKPKMDKSSFLASMGKGPKDIVTEADKKIKK